MERARSRWFAAGIAALAALAVYVLAPPAPLYGDAVELVDHARSGLRPYHNVLYSLAARAAVRAAGAADVAPAVEVLRGLSAVAAALGVGILALEAARRTARAAELAVWTLAIALAPGVLFFARTIEVHAVQLASAAFAVVLAILAGRRAPAVAGLLVLAGLFAATLGHATGAFLLPALLVLAWRRRRGAGIGPRTAAWVVPAGLLFPTLLDWIVSTFGTPVVAPLGNWVRWAVSGIPERGLFSFGEMLDHVWHESVRPAGALAVAPLALAALRSADRRPALAVLLALPAHLLLLPQVGVREEGGYFVSVLPLLAVSAAELCGALGRLQRGRAAAFAAAALLAVSQVALVLDLERRVGREPGPFAWAEAADRLLAPGSLVLVPDQVRTRAMKRLGHRPVGVPKLRELYPARQREDATRRVLFPQISRAESEGRRIYLDATLLEPDPERSELAHFLSRLRALDRHLVPRGDPPLLHELVHAPAAFAPSEADGGERRE